MTILKKTKNGKTYRSYNDGKTWISMTKFNQREWDDQTKEIEKGFVEGRYLTASGGFAHHFYKDFKDLFIEACNRRNLEPLKRCYEISIEGFKQNIPNFNEADFIERLIKDCNTIITGENETRSFSGIRTGSIGNEFMRFLRNEKELIESERQKKKTGYSNRQVHIACKVMGITIGEDNAEQWLKLTDNKNKDKFLASRLPRKLSDLSNLKDSRKGNTDHLKDLKAAKRLISGKKDKKAEKSITGIITAFELNRNNQS